MCYLKTMQKNLSTLFNNSKAEYILILCILLFSGIIRIPSLPQPLGPDQGVMAVIGEGLLNGKLPYRDFWEMGSPAIFMTYAVMFKVFGTKMAAIPITDLLVSMLTTFLVYLVSKNIWNKNRAYVAAIIFAFFSSGVRFGMHAGGDTAFGTFWYIAQRETFILPLTVGSIYFVLKGIQQNFQYGLIGLSGLLAGLSFVFKFPTLIFFMCLVIYLNGSIIVSSLDRKIFKKMVTCNMVIIFGFLMALLPFVLFFVSKGAFNEMIDVILRYVFSVYGQVEHNYLATLKRGLFHTFFIAEENFVLWLFMITSSIYIIFNDQKKENLLMVLWAISALLFVVSHREFFGYHYLVILPPFSILTGYGIMKVFETPVDTPKLFAKNVEKIFVGLLLLINVFVFAAHNFMHYTKFFYYTTGRISKTEYYSFFNAYPGHDYSFSSDYMVAQYIDKNTNPDDMIYIMGGIETVIHFLTKNESPSRFVFSSIIFSDSHGKGKKALAYRMELLHDLMNKTPKYIISIKPIETFIKFQDIHEFLKDNYILEKEFPDDRFVYINQHPKTDGLKS